MVWRNLPPQLVWKLVCRPTSTRCFKRAAELQGRTLTDFVVTAAREAVWRAIEEAEIIRLSVEDQRRIAEAIPNPPKPVPALRRAFKRRRELFGPA